MYISGDSKKQITVYWLGLGLAFAENAKKHVIINYVFSSLASALGNAGRSYGENFKIMSENYEAFFQNHVHAFHDLR